MIESHDVGGIRTVKFDRPDHRNALTETGLDELEKTLSASEQPVVYLTGTGSAFCAGADLATVNALDSESARDFAGKGQRIATTLETYDGVVVAGIDGPARGGGVELALACDLRVATPDATFAESGVSLGLFGAWGGTARLPRIVGEGAALDLALTGRILDASEAKQVGLCTQITEEPYAVAETVAENDPDALRTIKRRIRDTDAVARQEKRERDAFASLVDSAQFGEN